MELKQDHTIALFAAEGILPTVSLSSSHVQFDDSEEEDQGAAAEEADDTATPPQYDQQMPGYFQDFEKHLFDQSTHIEMLENRVDAKFQKVFARMEQMNIRGNRIEGKLDTLIRQLPILSSPRFLIY